LLGRWLWAVKECGGFGGAAFILFLLIARFFDIIIYKMRKRFNNGVEEQNTS
jgi:hypothetical protein